MVKTAAVLFLLCAQEKGSVEAFLEKAGRAEEGRGHVTARIEGETTTGGHGETLALAGSMALRVGECGDRALLVEVNEKGRKTGGVRTLVADGEAIVQASGCKFAVVWDLSKRKNFNPFELWRIGLGPALLEEFEVRIVRSPAESAPPPAVTGPDGSPQDPRPAKPSAGRKKGVCMAAEGADPAERCYVLRLVPKDEDLGKRIRSLQLYVNPGPWRIERMVVEGPGRVTTYVLTEFEAPERLDDALFEFDLSDAMVERR